MKGEYVFLANVQGSVMQYDPATGQPHAVPFVRQIEVGRGKIAATTAQGVELDTGVVIANHTFNIAVPLKLYEEKTQPAPEAKAEVTTNG